MQTFLPYASFRESAKALDYKRLGKQRVEAYQILRTLLGESQGWQSHPAVLMWRGYELHLYEYATTMCQEWIRRGYKDTLSAKLRELMERFRDQIDLRAPPPPWLGSDALHASHRSNLLRKDGIYYGRHGWSETPDLPYVWPMQKYDDAKSAA